MPDCGDKGYSGLRAMERRRAINYDLRFNLAHETAWINTKVVVPVYEFVAVHVHQGGLPNIAGVLCDFQLRVF